MIKDQDTCFETLHLNAELENALVDRPYNFYSPVRIKSSILGAGLIVQDSRIGMCADPSKRSYFKRYQEIGISLSPRMVVHPLGIFIATHPQDQTRRRSGGALPSSGNKFGFVDSPQLGERINQIFIEITRKILSFHRRSFTRKNAIALRSAVGMVDILREGRIP